MRKQNEKISLLVLNLMPNKLETENQLNYVFSDNNKRIEKTYCYPGTHHFKSVQPKEVQERYYKFDELQEKYYDGLIITGAPVEHIPFQRVDYWGEFCRIIKWSEKHCKKVLLLCWAAQAGMHCIAGVPKKVCSEKKFGIYKLDIQSEDHELLEGMDHNIWMPFSRYSTTDKNSISTEKFNIIADSFDVGPVIIETKDQKFTFVTGHPEYETKMLDKEYRRDICKGKKIKRPANYYTGQNNKIINTWTTYSQQLFNNWLNAL
ncbi:homoserine O-acetyltransferase/O-succinyltransferase family protein [Liquorilactobacillus aquaticus]|nr:homoserine O-succinyltransferase [Liquorilactobacillus aquaticus]